LGVEKGQGEDRRHVDASQPGPGSQCQFQTLGRLGAIGGGGVRKRVPSPKELKITAIAKMRFDFLKSGLGVLFLTARWPITLKDDDGTRLEAGWLPMEDE
jgi:hypothetical protein